MKQPLQFHTRVLLFSIRDKYLRTLTADQARLAIQRNQAELHCSDRRNIRAIRLLHEEWDGKGGSRMRPTKYSFREHVGGQTERPAVVWSLRKLGPTRDIFLEVLTSCLTDAR